MGRVRGIVPGERGMSYREMLPRFGRRFRRCGGTAKDVAPPSRRLSWGRPAHACEGKMPLRQGQGRLSRQPARGRPTKEVGAVIIPNNVYRPGKSELDSV